MIDSHSNTKIAQICPSGFSLLACMLAVYFTLITTLVVLNLVVRLRRIFFIPMTCGCGKVLIKCGGLAYSVLNRG